MEGILMLAFPIIVKLLGDTYVVVQADSKTAC